MPKKNKQLSIFHSPLKHKDTATQTEGCRHTNPSICGSHYLPDVCAFARSDELCLKPPLSWAKQFEKLKLKS
jgi:predicted nucleic acid binding AN1-type Zn finger protein